MSNDTIRFERADASETIAYVHYRAGVTVGDLSVALIYHRRKTVYGVKVKTVDDTWADTGYYGSYENCKQFIINDVYGIFWNESEQ